MNQTMESNMVECIIQTVSLSDKTTCSVLANETCSQDTNKCHLIMIFISFWGENNNCDAKMITDTNPESYRNISQNQHSMNFS